MKLIDRGRIQIDVDCVSQAFVGLKLSKSVSKFYFRWLRLKKENSINWIEQLRKLTKEMNVNEELNLQR